MLQVESDSPTESLNILHNRGKLLNWNFIITKYLRNSKHRHIASNVTTTWETSLSNESPTYSGITGGSEYVGKGGTGGDGDTAGAGSIEPGGSVKLSLFFDIW